MCLRISHENPHPRRRGRLTENYRDRVSFPEGPETRRAGPPQPHPLVGRRCRIMYTRLALTQGDSSRYSLLMGVLFSGALGPPGTCHASLGSNASPAVQCSTLVTPLDVKEPSTSQGCCNARDSRYQCFGVRGPVSSCACIDRPSGGESSVRCLVGLTRGFVSIDPKVETIGVRRVIFRDIQKLGRNVLDNCFL